MRRPPNAGRVASLNSKTLTCPLLSSVNRSIARSDRSTLDYVTDLVHEVTQDLPKLMLEELKKSLYIGLDDTQVKLIMPKEIPDQESGGDEPQIQRLIEKMKEAKKANQGNLHVILAPDSKMTRMACWSHARRKVYECPHLDREASNLPLALMNQLYDIERRASQRTVEARGELRKKESRPILERLKEFLDGPIVQNVLPSSNLGKAFKYLHNHWEALNVYM